jgi:biotin carboxyl carrier protein
MICDVIVGTRTYRLEFDRGADRTICRLDGREIRIDACRTRPDQLSLLIASRVYEVRREQVAGRVQLYVGREPYTVEVRDPRALRGRERVGESGPKKVVASMPGRVVRVVEAEGALVEAGQAILVLEAMKMQNEIKSPKAGVIRKLLVLEGGKVNAGDVLAVVE